ncbi:MAG: HTTM domain-containing protein [Myxococcota bacterium]
MNALRRLAELATTMHGQRALEIYRVVAGCTILFQFLSAYPQRHYLFGPDAVFPREVAQQTANFGLFTNIDSVVVFELAYHGSILVTLLWTLGVLLPVTTLLVLVAWRSLIDRIPGLGDGGDNLTQLLLCYALLCNLGGPGVRSWLRRAPQWLRDLRAIAHNTGLVAIWGQICVVYLIAGMSKIEGEAWRNGTALYYVLSTERFTIPEVAQLVLDSPLLMTVFAYVTVFFQLAFPFAVAFNRHARRVVLLLAVGFHVGIATVMGLTSFGLFMIAADLTFLSDDDAARIHATSRRLLDATRRRLLSLFKRYDARTPNEKGNTIV